MITYLHKHPTKKGKKMFNGEFRAKRQINLGGSNNRNRNRNRIVNRRVGGTNLSSGGGNSNFGSRPTNKASVLEEARIRREERKIQQLRKESSRRIQSKWRGYSKRKEVATNFFSLYIQNIECNNTPKTIGEDDEMSKYFTWRAIGFLLSRPLSAHYFSKKGQGSNEIEKMMFIMKQADIYLHQNKFIPDLNSFASVRIVHAAMYLLTVIPHNEQKPNVPTSDFPFLRIILTLSNLYLGRSYFFKIPSLLPSLLYSLQDSILKNPRGSITKALFDLTYRTLFQLNSESTHANANELQYAKACFGASLFCSFNEITPELLRQTLDPLENSPAQSSDSIESWTNLNLLEPLANCVHLSTTQNNDHPYSFQLQHQISYVAKSTTLNSESTKTRYINLLQQIIYSREANLLSNVHSFLVTNLGKNNPQQEEEFRLCSILVRILNYVLTKSPSLSVLIGMAASGMSLNSATKTSLSFDQSKADDIHQLDSSDDEDFDSYDNYGNGVEMSDGGITNKKSDKSKIRTKESYLTIPKLERIFSQNIAYQQETIVSNKMTPSLFPLASKFSEGELLLKTGITIFSQDSQKPLNSPCELNELKRLYCSILSKILKRNKKSSIGYLSPLLSTMTLRGQSSHDFLNLLWAFVQSQIMLRDDSRASLSTKERRDDLSASIVFCDLLQYSLLSKDDDEFLNMYTNVENVSYRGAFLAKEIIVWLRDLLQDLYWIRPVTSSQYTSTSHLENEDSILLLLCGTKLYNDLYKRWCRVHKSNLFCEEKTWWFPHHSRIMGKMKDGEQVIVTEESTGINDDTMGERTMNQTNMDNEVESAALASLFRDAKIARLLTGVPQSLPFHRRVALFNSLIDASKSQTQSLDTLQDFVSPSNGARKLFKIRRDNLFNDSMEQLNKEGSNLRSRIQIKFVNEHGFEEAGVDGGGVFKEFLEDLVRESIRSNIDVPLFAVSSLETLYPSPGTEHMQKHYAFVGRVLGKAVYESILVDPQFCTPFLNTLLGKQNTLDDLKYLDPEFYRHLKELRKMKKHDIEGLGLSFELTTATGRSIELIPNGSNIPLTKDNLLRYIHLVSHYKLNVEGALQTRAFLRGFRDLIATPWLQLFSSFELQKLISGDDSVQGIDVRAMKETIVYAGGYHPSQPIIQWFWEVLEHEFSPEQQRMFLKFMTSCSRQPLLGFAALSPLPCIRQVPLSDNMEIGDGKDVKLPTSSTCMNLLKLPKYDNKKQLKEKLMYAIESGAGFELS